MKSKNLYQEIWQEPYWPDRSEWKKVLGSAVQSVPPHLWEEKMFFMGADDLELKKQTQSFPGHLHKNSSSHPIYVLKTISNFAHRLCPCSSKRQPVSVYIKKGCSLNYTGYIMDRDSYLLEWIEFSLPRQTEFLRGLDYKGIVPEECLQRN